jgi:hypothetical protein
LATYDKLTPWHIHLHGGIDEGSHFLLWVVVSMDKKKETIFAMYSIAIAKYGHPIRVQLDCVVENSLM